MAIARNFLHKNKHHVIGMKTWPLIILCAATTTTSVIGLRNNYATMVDKREALYQADEQGKSIDEIEAKLQDLRNFVTSHMNTNLRSGDLSIKEAPIQLSGLYTKAFEAEKERVSRVNEKLYTEAQAECEKQFPIGLSGSGRIPCIEQYINARGEKARDIPREAYMFDFVSPTWSLDLAGISIVATILLLILIAGKILMEQAVILYLKYQES